MICLNKNIMICSTNRELRLVNEIARRTVCSFSKTTPAPRDSDVINGQLLITYSTFFLISNGFIDFSKSTRIYSIFFAVYENTVVEKN